MWRPLFFRRPRCLRCLCRVQSLGKRIESRAQRLNFLLLPVDDVAQLTVRALKEGYFRFNPFDCIAVHADSVTVIGGASLPRRGFDLQQLEPGGVITLESFPD